MRLNWHECQGWQQPNGSNQKERANDNGDHVRDENLVGGYVSRQVSVSSWLLRNSIHLLWFLIVATVGYHFAIVAAAAAHQTTVLNSKKIQHVLCILSDDDYQLYWRWEKTGNIKVLQKKMIVIRVRSKMTSRSEGARGS